MTDQAQQQEVHPIEERASALFGAHGWQTALSEVLGVNISTVHRWKVAGNYPVYVQQFLTALEVLCHMYEQDTLQPPEPYDEGVIAMGRALVDEVWSRNPPAFLPRRGSSRRHHR